MFRAFADDYDRITVEYEKGFALEHKTLFQLEETPLVFLGRQKNKDRIQDSFACPFDLDLAKSYTVKSENGQCDLQYRYLVKTKLLYAEYRYEGQLLVFFGAE